MENRKKKKIYIAKAIFKHIFEVLSKIGSFLKYLAIAKISMDNK